MRWLLCLFLCLVSVPCWAGGQEKFSEAENLWQQYKREEAAASYLAALESGELSKSQRVAAHYNVAIYYFLIEKPEKALENTNTVLTLQPDHAGGLSLRANTYDRLRDDAHALADWDRLLQIDPNDALVYNDRSYFYLERGDLDRAISEMETYLKMQPDSPEQIKQLNLLKARRANKSPWE